MLLFLLLFLLGLLILLLLPLLPLMSRCPSHSLFSSDEMNDSTLARLLDEGISLCERGEVVNGSTVYCSPSNPSLLVQSVIAFSFISLIVAAITGNVVVMWIIYRHKVMHHAFNIFLFNMALADLLIALFNVGTSWTYNVYYDWWYGDLCPVTLFFGVAPTCVSVFSMMALSWDRCQAVVNPLYRRPLSIKKALIRIAVIWFLSSLIALPNMLFYKITTGVFYSSDTHSITTPSTCFMSFPSAEEFMDIPLGLWYDRGLFILQYALPLIILTLTFTRIAYVLRESSKAQLLRSTHRSIDPGKAKRKVIKMVALMVGVFMICWFPYHGYHTFSEIFNIESGIGYTFVYWLAMAPCAANPIIYCYSNKRFRIGFRYVFRHVPYVECERREYTESALFSHNARSAANKTESREYSKMRSPVSVKGKASRL